MRNDSGQMTLDFLFSCMLILGTTVVLTAMTIALTLTEVLQYVTFSGARTYFAAQFNVANQRADAQAKVNSLMKTLPYLAGAVQSDWLRVSSSDAQNYSGYRDTIGAPASPTDRNQFVGYQIQFSVPLLDIHIPMLSRIFKSPDGEEGVKATVSSFLLREPTWQECDQFNKAVYPTLLSLDPIYNRAVHSPGVKTPANPINDNGC